MNLTPEQLREVLWVVFEKDGNDLFCSTHSQLVKDRHQQLIEEFPDQGPYEVRKYVPYVTHADALEENKRLAAKVAELETALLGIKQYREKNPLGGPAKVFDAMADQIRAGDDFNKVIADYGWCPVSRAERAEAERDAMRVCLDAPYNEDKRRRFHAEAELAKLKAHAEAMAFVVEAAERKLGNESYTLAAYRAEFGNDNSSATG